MLPVKKKSAAKKETTGKARAGRPPTILAPRQQLIQRLQNEGLMINQEQPIGNDELVEDDDDEQRFGLWQAATEQRVRRRQSQPPLALPAQQQQQEPQQQQQAEQQQQQQQEEGDDDLGCDDFFEVESEQPLIYERPEDDKTTAEPTEPTVRIGDQRYAKAYYLVRRPLYASVNPSIRRGDDGLLHTRIRFEAFNDGSLTREQRDEFMDPAEKKREREGYDDSGIALDANDSLKQMGYGVDLNEVELFNFVDNWPKLIERFNKFRVQFGKSGRSQESCLILSGPGFVGEKPKAVFFGSNTGLHIKWIEIKPCLRSSNGPRVRAGNTNWRWEAFFLSGDTAIDKLGRVIQKLKQEIQFRFHDASLTHSEKKDVIRHAESHLEDILFDLLDEGKKLHQWASMDEDTWGGKCSEWVSSLNLGAVGGRMISRCSTTRKAYGMLSLRQMFDLLYRTIRKDGMNHRDLVRSLYKRSNLEQITLY